MALSQITSEAPHRQKRGRTTGSEVVAQANGGEVYVILVCNIAKALELSYDFHCGGKRESGTNTERRNPLVG